MYAKDIYLWNDALPNFSTYLPRDRYKNVSPEINAIREEIYDISQLKINNSTHLPFEYLVHKSPKYSYVIESPPFLKELSRSNRKLESNEVVMSQMNDIAYLAIHSFPTLKSIKSTLDDIFFEFSINNPTNIVLDLRYNNGGYIETVEYLANLIAPSSLNGKVMYSEEFNQTLQSGRSTFLKNQAYLDNQGKSIYINGRKATLDDINFQEEANTFLFNKVGQLESVRRIYFITSETTASGSELLISLFKPYINLQTVGKKTFGKPVGFLPINVKNYSIFLSSFLIKNADGWSEYFDGIKPDLEAVLTISPNLGNPEENCLKRIVQDINKGREIRQKNYKMTKKSIRDYNSIDIQPQIIKSNFSIKR
ncbi:MAG: carboxyl-terminal protease [Sphingobacterium sp.]|nr:carboxyl-terminal protease [Sphingobacterium sp.]